MQRNQSAGNQIITPPHSAASPKREPLGRRLVKALLITLLAYFLSLLFAQPFMFSLSSVLSSTDKSDFNLTDFYNIVADSRPERWLDTDVVVVDIAGTDRADIADVLISISDMKPAAVGLDVTFNEERPGDSLLIDAMLRCPNLIMAVGVNEAPGKPETFMVDDYSYFYPDCADNYAHGVVNFPTQFSGAAIREFRGEYVGVNGDTMPALSVALVELAHPDAAAKFRRRSDAMTVIDFPSRTFNTLHWSEVPDNFEKIVGKIVLIGSMAEFEDVHATPVNNKMPGVLIHAYAISTILRSVNYVAVGRVFNMAIAFLFCFMLCYTNITYTSPARAMWMRLIQLLAIYLLLRVGYYLFVDRQIIFDFSYTLLMVLFGFFALDLWIGMEYYVKKLINKLRKS